MKKYTKPVVSRVVLNPEQAVLGTCSATWVKIKDARPLYCRVNDCKQKRDARGSDSGPNS